MKLPTEASSLAIPRRSPASPGHIRIAYFDFVPEYPQCSHSTYVVFPT